MTPPPEMAVSTIKEVSSWHVQKY